jgi:hypothetical protein
MLVARRTLSKPNRIRLGQADAQEQKVAAHALRHAHRIFSETGREGAAVADDQDASPSRARVSDDIRGEHEFPGLSQGDRLGIVLETIPD